ncbi:MAG: amidohydrolase [Bacteroidales bacterium]|nr:amidohydrolase [Bacteroidales bacterium]
MSDQDTNLNITFIQTELAWEQIDRNLEHFNTKINEISKETDLVILPEMFTTGFSMQPERLAEPKEGKSLKWMQSVAADKHVTLIGSLIIRENDNYFNRLFVVLPEGNYKIYDKRHLFRMGEENKHYTAGQHRVIFHLGNWRILPLICYDLRFPVWSRNHNDYDLAVYIANWPEVRRHVWKSLLVARALENQVYIAGVNRIGKDGKDLTYSGDSMVIDPRGNIISKTEPHQESVETLSLSLDELNRFREKFPVGKDADEFVIK